MTTIYICKSSRGFYSDRVDTNHVAFKSEASAKDWCTKAHTATPLIITEWEIWNSINAYDYKPGWSEREKAAKAELLAKYGHPDPDFDPDAFYARDTTYTYEALELR